MTYALGKRGWLGASDRTTEDTFTWLDGRPIPNRWGANEVGRLLPTHVLRRDFLVLLQKGPHRHAPPCFLSHSRLMRAFRFTLHSQTEAPPRIVLS